MSEKERVNFFIVGFQKCGTSSLLNYLNQHPEISMTGGLGYFCKDFHKESDNFYGKKLTYNIRNFKQYQEKFDFKNEKIIGEKTAEYLYSKEAAKNIYNYNPNAKIIIMIRDPFEFVRSWHFHSLKMRSENEKDLEKAMKLELIRKKGKKIPKSAFVPSYTFYSEMIKFSKQIERFINYFPKKQIQIIILEDMKKRPHDEYKKILEFLNAKNTEFLPNFEIINKGAKVRSNMIQNIIRNPDLKIKLLIRKIINPQRLEFVYKKLLRANMKNSEKPKMKPEFEKKLKSLCEKEVEKLEELLYENSFISKKNELINKWKYK